MEAGVAPSDGLDNDHRRAAADVTGGSGGILGHERKLTRVQL